MLRNAIIDREGAVVVYIPPDLLHLRPLDAWEEWTFALAIVAYKPDVYTLNEPVVDDIY